MAIVVGIEDSSGSLALLVLVNILVKKQKTTYSIYMERFCHNEKQALRFNKRTYILLK